MNINTTTAISKDKELELFKLCSNDIIYQTLLYEWQEQNSKYLPWEVDETKRSKRINEAFIKRYEELCENTGVNPYPPAEIQENEYS